MANEKGIFMGMTSQCIDGRVRMTVYESGRDLLNFYSSTEYYRSGAFDKVLLRAVEKYDEIKENNVAATLLKVVERKTAKGKIIQEYKL